LLVGPILVICNHDITFEISLCMQTKVTQNCSHRTRFRGSQRHRSALTAMVPSGPRQTFLYGPMTALLLIFSARQHAERAIMLSQIRLSVCPSVCPSHGWISRKRLNLGSCNFHHTVAPSLSCVRYKFHPEIPTGSPRAGASNEGGLGKRANIVAVLTLSSGGSTS